MSTHKYLDTTGLGQVWGKIKDLIPESDIFWINVTSTTVDDVTTYSADKTFTEIVAAYNNNKHCVLKNSQGVYSLETVTPTRVTFMMTYYSSFQRYFSTSVTINSSNVVTVSDAPFFTFTGSNNIYPRRDLIAQVNANFNSAPTTGNLTYSTTAYRAYSKGDLFWLSNTVLARATTDIASGATLTKNTNYVKTTIENEIKQVADESLGVYKVTFSPLYNSGNSIEGYESDVNWNEIRNRCFNLDGLDNRPIVFYLNDKFFGFVNVDWSDDRYPAFYAEQFSKNYSDDGSITEKEVLTINHNNEITLETIEYPYDHAPEDDIEVLNLLSQYDYPAPISDADGDVITDANYNIILG